MGDLLTCCRTDSSEESVSTQQLISNCDSKRDFSKTYISDNELKISDPETVANDLNHSLSDCKVSELELPDKVIILQNETDAQQAVQTLIKNQIRAAPVIDADNNEFIGVLDVRNTLHYSLERLSQNNYSLGGELSKINWHLVISSSKLSLAFTLQKFHTVYKSDCLLKAAKILATGPHIVGVLDCNDNLTGIITQTILFQYAAKKWHFNVGSDCLLQRLLDLKYITSPINPVKHDFMAFEVFEMMATLSLSGLAVVDDEGKLIHAVCASDIKLWMKAPETLQEPIEEFLIDLRKQLIATTIYPYSSCRLEQTLQQAIIRLHNTKYHRVWMVDHENVPVGVLAITDIFKFVFKIKH